jgi:hypothetical protein
MTARITVVRRELQEKENRCPGYLLIVTDQNAARLESWLGGGLEIRPLSPGAPGVPVAGLDAVTDDELTAVDLRLRTGGPRYHAGGPAAGRAGEIARRRREAARRPAVGRRPRRACQPGLAAALASRRDDRARAAPVADGR